MQEHASSRWETSMPVCGATMRAWARNSCLASQTQGKRLKSTNLLPPRCLVNPSPSSSSASHQLVSGLDHAPRQGIFRVHQGQNLRPQEPWRQGQDHAKPSSSLLLPLPRPFHFLLLNPPPPPALSSSRVLRAAGPSLLRSSSRSSSRRPSGRIWTSLAPSGTTR
eukprot:768135-Hanusia_phi.AAC.4